MKKIRLNSKGRIFLFYLQAMMVTVKLRWLLFFKKMPQLLHYIESRHHQRTIAAHEIDIMLHILAQVAQYKFFFIRNHCLRKNLLFYYYLVQTGAKDLTLNIGVLKTNDQLEGHCWLTLEGNVLLDTEENIRPYAVIYSSGV